jgi:GH15 family glucan-1,4-alpha-glucosidase
LIKMGHSYSARRFLEYLKRILKSKNDSFQIMYGIRGEKDLTETELSHLAGYENTKPVRIGNAAYSQRQNDVFGYLLNIIHQYYEFFPGTLDELEDIWEIVRNICRTISTHWEKPDKGIWEIRSGEKHYVFSKVMSWVAMDRATKIATSLNKHYYAETWGGIANDIKEDVFRKGWKEKLQTFTQTYCNSELDASLLLMAEYGFISPDDMRYKKTVMAVKNALFYNGLVYRYKNPDDFGKPMSSFTICTFWLVQALFRTGLKEEARNIFENLLACSNHLSLFSEDIHFSTKRLLGNFPQAYSHLALINTAILFSEKKYIPKFIKP